LRLRRREGGRERGHYGRGEGLIRKRRRRVAMDIEDLRSYPLKQFQAVPLHPDERQHLREQWRREGQVEQSKD